MKTMNNINKETLKKVMSISSEKLTLVMTYDPRLPKMSAVVQKHFRTLIVDPGMKDIFQKKGMQVAYKRHRNVREFLCRARLYDQQDRRNPTRDVQLGWRKCNKCTTCRHSENASRFKISASNEMVQIKQRLDCKRRNMLYVIVCSKCPHKPQYISKTKHHLEYN